MRDGRLIMMFFSLALLVVIMFNPMENSTAGKAFQILMVALVIFSTFSLYRSLRNKPKDPA